MKLRVLLTLLFVTLAPSLALAVAPVEGTEQNKRDVARAEAYLNSLHNVEARFLQSTEDGATAGGQLQIQRPGKMRLTYDPPATDFIVADGDFVNLWDGEMQQSSTLPQGESLADIILRENLRLSGDLTVTKIERFPARLEITVVESKNPDDGSLTLVFEDNPLQLRQWRVQDAQGRSTSVALQGLHEVMAFPGATFTYRAPNFGRNLKTQPMPR